MKDDAIAQLSEQVMALTARMQFFNLLLFEKHYHFVKVIL
jgi:hypothetical protein